MICHKHFPLVLAILWVKAIAAQDVESQEISPSAPPTHEQASPLLSGNRGTDTEEDVKESVFVPLMQPEMFSPVESLADYLAVPYLKQEKVPRYFSTILSIIQSSIFMGMYLYHLKNPDESPSVKLVQDNFFYGAIASSVTSTFRWANWGIHRYSPPENRLSYFQGYDPLNIKKLEIVDLANMLFIAMIPLTIETYSVSTGYFVTCIVFSSLMTVGLGYKGVSYFKHRPTPQY